MKTPKIISKERCKKKFLFHSSSKNIKILDPKYCKKVNEKYEHKKPTIHAFDKITNEYCFEPVGEYERVLKSGISWAHHKLKLKGRTLFLGTKLKGYIYVLDGTEFYEIIRKDFMQGKWIKAKEYVCYKKLKPIKKVKITKPIDVENIKEYEYLGQEFVGLMNPRKYLKLCKNDKVKEAIKKAMNKKFKPYIPRELKNFV
jgi:hypothetical protein